MKIYQALITFFLLLHYVHYSNQHLHISVTKHLMVMSTMKKQEPKDNNNDANAFDVLILLYEKYNNEISLDFDMNFDY